MVTIVGAGPAGATAALTLARAGVTVRLLDRSKFPRNKPCGGAISVRALRRFPYLERALSRIATHWVSRLYLEGPDGDSVEVESEGPTALMIRRVEFDHLLVSLAVEAGAELVSGVDVVRAKQDAHAVTLDARDGRRFETPIAIAADGVHSIVARRLGLNAGWASTAVALDMMEETPRTELRDVDPSTLWVAYGYEPTGLPSRRRASAGNGNGPLHATNPTRGAPVQSEAGGRAAEGYAYIFPKRDHVNVGVGYVLDHFRRSVDVPPYELQRAFVGQLRERGLIEWESVPDCFTPFLIPVGGPLRHPGAGRVLLAGDAGGFVNGFTAEGIYYAMVSGDLAARAVIQTSSAGVAALAARYRRACRREMGAELSDSVLIQRFLFADRHRIARGIRGASASPLTRLFVDVAAGRAPYARLRRRLVTTLPLVAARLAWQRAQSTIRWGATRRILPQK